MALSLLAKVRMKVKPIIFYLAVSGIQLAFPKLEVK